MAVVWEARDSRLGRLVAIKIPTEGIASDPAFVRRFEREAQLAASLAHPNLVPIFDYGGAEEERPYLVMELIEGESLSRRLKEGRAVDTWELASALLGALEHIHRAGIVHRDIKPGNVMLDQSGRILLTDFGIAQSAEATQLTGTGMVIGTPRYIAPELMRGGRATQRSDLFACGVLLEQVREHNRALGLEHLIDELTAENPAERPDGAEQALAILADSDREPTAQLDPDPPDSTSTTQPLRRRPPAEVIATRTTPSEPEPTPVPRRPPPPRASPPPAPASTTNGARARGSRGWIGGLLAAGAIVGIVIAVIALSGGGSENTSGNGNGSGANASKSGSKGGGAKANAAAVDPATTDPTTSTTSSSSTTAAASGSDPALGTQLNNEGFSQLNSGDYPAARDTLSQAVAAFPDDSTDINYAYALFNYAQALRFTGDAAGAIPLLEKRLAISDFKVDEVKAELKTARKEAGK